MKRRDIKKRIFEKLEYIDPILKERRLVENQLMEAEAVPFKMTPQRYADEGMKDNYSYKFNVNDLPYHANLFHDNRKHNDGVFELSFGTEDKGDFHRVGKDLKHMNTVLQTVAAITRDFINKEPHVEKIKIEGAVDQADVDQGAHFFSPTKRKNAYLRFIQNNFPEYDVTDAGRFIEIKVRDEVDNALNRAKNMLKSVSSEPIPTHALQGVYHNDKQWQIDTDFIDPIYIDINADGQYGIYVTGENFDTGEEFNETFQDFESMEKYVRQLYANANAQ